MYFNYHQSKRIKTSCYASMRRWITVNLKDKCKQNNQQTVWVSSFDKSSFNRKPFWWISDKKRIGQHNIWIWYLVEKCYKEVVVVKSWSEKSVDSNCACGHMQRIILIKVIQSCIHYLFWINYFTFFGVFFTGQIKSFCFYGGLLLLAKHLLNKNWLCVLD